MTPELGTTTTSAWTLHPDRALPAEPGTRAVARTVLAATSGLPIVSMHGHVDAALLADDAPFPDPAALLVTPDHYLVRMLVSQANSPGPVRDSGVRSVADLGATPLDGDDRAAAPDSRTVWRRFAAGWDALRGTPTRAWLEHTLVDVFEAPFPPGVERADDLYDHLAERLARPEYRPRALFERFGIELLATTDPPTSTLEAHGRLAASGWGRRVIPTFRPDQWLEPGRPGWRDRLAELSTASGIDAFGYDGLLEALRARRAAFVAAGARAADHGHEVLDTTPLPGADARRLTERALRGEIAPGDAAALRADLLFQQAAMSADDGLVMQVHPGILRDHDGPLARRYGHDLGFDIPVAAEFTRALRPVLEAFGHHPGFRMIAFTVDETVYSRELAPLAGAYPALRIGAPWWFLDSTDAMRRFREATVETAGFRNTSGFVDDTRAFCSIPARHDLSRRADAAYLARLVAEHRLDLDEAVDTAVDLAYRLPRESYPDPLEPR